MKYCYGNNDEEFVLSYKGRPFSVLTSDELPTPSSSYIDHLLVRELDIKMTDLQCLGRSLSVYSVSEMDAHVVHFTSRPVLLSIYTNILIHIAWQAKTLKLCYEVELLLHQELWVTAVHQLDQEDQLHHHHLDLQAADQQT